MGELDSQFVKDFVSWVNELLSEKSNSEKKSVYVAQ